MGVRRSWIVQSTTFLVGVPLFPETFCLKLAGSTDYKKKLFFKLNLVKVVSSHCLKDEVFH